MRRDSVAQRLAGLRRKAAARRAALPNYPVAGDTADLDLILAQAWPDEVST